MMAGLGIDFNPPPSPPRNPHIARLQGKDLTRRPLPSAPALRHAISLDALQTDRRVRIAHTPEIIGQREVAYDDEEDDERYADGEDDHRTASLSRSQNYYDHVARGRPQAYHPTYEVRRQPLGCHGMQRPHSMMELADLYAAQSISPTHSVSPDGTSSSTSHDSNFSPEESPATTVSPSSCSSGKASAPRIFVPELPSQRIVHSRQQSDSTQHALEALHRARAVSEAARAPAVAPLRTARPAAAEDPSLQRQTTLMSTSAPPARRQKELNRLLAPGTALKRKPSTVVLEQAASKGKARVELDVVLESALVVEGGMLRGRMEVCIRGGESEVWVSNPKARVVGFEELAAQDTRNVFYHHAATIEAAALPFVGSEADKEGFVRGKPGAHTFPFSLHLPIGKGAKGPLKCKQGVVRYIVIGSMKLKAADGSDRSIAHFYRHVDVFPYLNPAVILASSLKPIAHTTDRALFMGGSGKVHLTASLHRANWVAGQRCYVDIAVRNETAKKIKSLTFTLMRTISVFRPKERTDDAEADPTTSETTISRKKVAEETLELGKKGGAKGGVTAKGMWVGVDKGESVEFSHPVLVPADALTISRGRHLEVAYELKVTIGAGPLSADVSAEVPIRIINFVSLDPPPGHVVEAMTPDLVSEAPAVQPVMSSHDPRAIARSWSIDELRAPVKTAPELDRMVSMDSLRLSDLNALYGGGSLHRTDSASSASSIGMSRQPSLPVSSAAEELVERAKSRQLKHQMSLDCIGSAIASATARRLGGGTPSRSNLRDVVMAEDDDDLPPVPAVPSSYYDGPLEPGAVQLDDLDDVPDDYDQGPASDYEDAQGYEDLQDDVAELSEEELIDESEDEIDAVLERRAFDDVDEDAGPVAFGSMAPPQSPPSRRVIPPTSPRRNESPRRPVISRATSLATIPASPVKSSPSPPLTSVVKSPRKPSLATATSPVKAPTLTSRVSSTSLQRQQRVTGSPEKRSRKLPPATLNLDAKRTTSGPRAMPSPAKQPVFVHSRSNEPSPEFEGHLSGESASSSPSTEDARTPPLVTPPFVVESTFERQQAGILRSPPRVGKAPAAVRHRVTALENRSAALKGVSVGIGATGLHRHASVVSTASSAGFGGVVDLGRATSMASFKAPLLRR